MGQSDCVSDYVAERLGFNYKLSGILELFCCQTRTNSRLKVVFL